MHSCANLTGWRLGECFWSLDSAVLEWPRVLVPRCEAQFAVTPYIAEFFSTTTALLFVYLGLVQLLCSGHSDEVVDLAASVFVLNGASAALSHGTQVREKPEPPSSPADAHSSNALFLALLAAVAFLGSDGLDHDQCHGFTLFLRRLISLLSIVRTAAIRTSAHTLPDDDHDRMHQYACVALRDTSLVFALLSERASPVCAVVWNGHSVPNPDDWRWHNLIVVTVGIANIGFFLMLVYSRAHWHFGEASRSPVSTSPRLSSTPASVARPCVR